MFVCQIGAAFKNEDGDTVSEQLARLHSEARMAAVVPAPAAAHLVAARRISLMTFFSYLTVIQGQRITTGMPTSTGENQLTTSLARCARCSKLKPIIRPKEKHTLSYDSAYGIHSFRSRMEKHLQWRLFYKLKIKQEIFVAFKKRDKIYF